MDTTIQQPSPPLTAQEESSEPPPPPALVPSNKTPQAFYAEITKRPDVREILEELATG